MNPSENIDNQLARLTDWRGPIFKRLREIIHEVDPDITEEWKWETGVFTHNGLVCAIGGFKDHLKINFFKGASLKDPDKLFNAGLESKATRAIDFHEGDTINETALKSLIGSAVEINTSK